MFGEKELHAAKAAATLFYVKRSGNRADLRDTYREVATQKPEPPYEELGRLVSGFSDICNSYWDERKPPRLSSVYWISGTNYDPSEVFLTAIQFLDDHKLPLPETTLPPESDVKKFSDFILDSPRRVLYAEQFEKLMELSKGNPTGAANIGFITGRHFARGGDTRAYPSVPVDTAQIREWASKMPFIQGSTDASGDNYYFWTHLFGALALRGDGSARARFYDKVFENGTPVMVAVRKYAVGQPTTSEHKEASKIGRSLGISLAERFARE